MGKNLLDSGSRLQQGTTEHLWTDPRQDDSELELDLPIEDVTEPAPAGAMVDTDATICVRARQSSGGLPGVPHVAGYEILEELGRGGMGVVYKAWQHSLQRTVALKMILAGSFAGAEDLQRFRAEAMAIARLHHPHLLNIFEIGENQQLPFYAMEHMEGGSLSHRLTGQPIAPRVAAGLLCSLAQAMDYAHKNGIVHRDLKPANVLLSGSADTPLENCIAKITDFGIAKHLNDNASVTRTGDILGTPHYMAPEQALGRSTLIGPAADIYSLGAILYELLTGRAPFQGRSGADVILLLAKEDPDRPSVWLRTIPRDLETICLKCLEKDPARRYVSAAALADDLTRYLHNEPIHARPASLLDRGIKWTRRRPALAVILLMTAGLVLLSLGIMAMFMQQAVERAEKAQFVSDMQKEMLLRSNELLADAFLERGIHLAEKGDVRRGMHWMLRSLEMTEATATQRDRTSDLAPIIRMNLASWGECVASREASLPHVDWVWDIAYSPDQRFVATASKDKKVQFWDAQSAAPVGPALEHPHAVWGIAFHPDGSTLFSACGDYAKAEAGQLRAWSPRPGKPGEFVPRGEPVDLPYSVGRLVMHPRGDRVWVGSYEGAASLFAFDAQAAGNGFTLLKTFADNHQLCTLSPDGAILATIAGEPSELPPYFVPSGELHLWDARTGATLGEPLQHKGPVRTAFFSKDSKHLVVGSATHGDAKQAETSMLHVWDVARRKQVAASPTMLGRIKTSAIAGSGRLFAVSVFEYRRDADSKKIHVTDGNVVLWQLNGEGQIEQHGGALRPGHVVWSMAFSPDGRMLLAGCENSGAFLWSVSNGQLLKPPLWHEGNCVKVLFSRDGRQAVTASAGGGLTVSARLWEVPRFAHLGPPLVQPAPIRSAFWDRDGVFAYIGCYHSLARWDHERGIIAESIPMPERVEYYHRTTERAGFLADLGNQQLGVLDRQANQFARLSAKFGPAARGSGFDYCAEAGVFLQYWGRPSGLRILDRQGEPLTRRVADPEHELTARRLSPAGDILAVAQTINLQSNRVMIYDARDLSLRHEIPVQHEIRSLAFTPDGKTLALGGRDRQVQRIDVQTGKFLGAPLLHEGVVHWISYLASDRLLATSSEKGHILLWDVQTGKRVGPGFEVRSDLMSIAVHPRGKYLLTATSGKLAMTWRLPEPVAGNIEQIRLWVETMTGMEMNAQDAIIPLDSQSLLERRQRLAKEPRTK